MKCHKVQHYFYLCILLLANYLIFANVIILFFTRIYVSLYNVHICIKSNTLGTSKIDDDEHRVRRTCVPNSLPFESKDHLFLPSLILSHSLTSALAETQNPVNNKNHDLSFSYCCVDVCFKNRSTHYLTSYILPVPSVVTSKWKCVSLN